MCYSVKKQTSWRPNITNITSLPHQHHTTSRTISIPYHLYYHQQQHGHYHYHRHQRHHHHISIIPTTSISTTTTPPAPVPSARAPPPAAPPPESAPPPTPAPPAQPSPYPYTILTNGTTVTDIIITAPVLPSTTTKSPCKSPQTLKHRLIYSKYILFKMYFPSFLDI